MCESIKLLLLPSDESRIPRRLMLRLRSFELRILLVSTRRFCKKRMRFCYDRRTRMIDLRLRRLARIICRQVFRRSELTFRDLIYSRRWIVLSIVRSIMRDMRRSLVRKIRRIQQSRKLRIARF